MLRKRRQFIALISLLASAAIAIHESSKPKVKAAADLAGISGHISSYSFKDGARGYHHYVIRLSEYRTNFQIPADFIGCFSKDRFQSDLKNGDSLSVSIPKGKERTLSSEERLFIFSARTRTTTYLSEQDTLGIYNSDSNIVISLLFLVIGTGLILWRPKNTPNKSTHRMSGENVDLKLEHRGTPLIGGLRR